MDKKNQGYRIDVDSSAVLSTENKRVEESMPMQFFYNL